VLCRLRTNRWGRSKQRGGTRSASETCGHLQKVDAPGCRSNGFVARVSQALKPRVAAGTARASTGRRRDQATTAELAVQLDHAAAPAAAAPSAARTRRIVGCVRAGEHRVRRAAATAAA